MASRSAELLRIAVAATCALGAVSLALADDSPAQLLPGPPGGGAAGSSPNGALRVSTTGDYSERRRTLPIARTPAGGKHVVMSMTPAQLPSLAAGDFLWVTAELEVTTDCLNRELGRHCIASSYRYNPVVGAELIVTGDPASTVGVPVAEPQRIVCRQKLPSREHHCMIVFPGGGLNVENPATLPCTPGGCHVNLVANAYHRRARGNDRLIVGGDEDGGGIQQDKGRINVVRLRPGALPLSAAAITHTVTEPLTRGMALGPPRREVIYSQPLEGLERGEQLEVTAVMRTGVVQLRHNARVSTRVILASSPEATQPVGLPEEVASLDGEITEGNGFNCTQRTTPCETVKVGVLEIEKDLKPAPGPPPTLYVNVVSGIHAKLGRSPGDNLVQVRDGGFLEVIRYPAALNG